MIIKNNKIPKEMIGGNNNTPCKYTNMDLQKYLFLCWEDKAYPSVYHQDINFDLDNTKTYYYYINNFAQIDAKKYEDIIGLLKKCETFIHDTFLPIFQYIKTGLFFNDGTSEEIIESQKILLPSAIEEATKVINKTNNTAVKMLLATEYYIQLFQEINEKYNELAKSFGYQALNIDLDLWDNYIHYNHCRLPTRNDLPTENNKITIYFPFMESKIIYRKYICFLYEIYSLPKVGNIYNGENYRGLKNLFANININIADYNRLQYLFDKLIESAIDFNDHVDNIKKYNKNCEKYRPLSIYTNYTNLFLDSYLGGYNAALQNFTGIAREITSLHYKIWNTHIWVVHEPLLWKEVTNFVYRKRLTYYNKYPIFNIYNHNDKIMLS